LHQIDSPLVSSKERRITSEGQIFFCGQIAVFAGGFAKNSVQEMVFVWLICGGTLVGDGQLMVSFLVGKNTPRIWNLFLSSSHFGNEDPPKVGQCSRE
jgi:hypothetical protein